MYHSCIGKSHLRLLLRKKQLAFDEAYKNKHYDVAKWLYDLKDGLPIDIHHDNEYLFRNACSKEYIDGEQLEWLLDLSLKEEKNGGKMIDINKHDIFENCRRSTTTNTYKYLYKLSKKYGGTPDFTKITASFHWTIDDFKWYYRKILGIVQKRKETHNDVRKKLVSILVNFCYYYVLKKEEKEHMEKLIFCYNTTKYITKYIGSVINAKEIFYLLNKKDKGTEHEENKIKDLHFFVMKWLFESAAAEGNPIDFSDNDYTFFSNCCNGYRGMDKLIFLFNVYAKCETTDFTKMFTNENLIKIGSHYDDIVWFNETAKTYNIQLNLNYDNDYLFRIGGLDLHKYVYENSKVDIHACNDDAFTSACDYKNIDIASYVYNLGIEDEKNGGRRVNIHMVYKSFDFEDLCINFEVMKYVYELSIEEEKIGFGHRYDIHFCDDIFFVKCCKWNFEHIKWFYGISLEEERLGIGRRFNVSAHNNKFMMNVLNLHYWDDDREKILDWLFDVAESSGNLISIHVNNEAMFRSYCKQNKLELAKKLYDKSLVDESLGTDKRINVHAESDEAFKNSCEWKHEELAKWLCSICEDYIIVYNDNKMIPKIFNSMTTKMLEVKDILKRKKKSGLLKIYDDAKVVISDKANEDDEEDIICPICMSSDDLDFKNTKLWVELDCSDKHIVCLHCFQMIDKCPYKCKPCFDLYGCKFVKQIR